MLKPSYCLFKPILRQQSVKPLLINSQRYAASDSPIFELRQKTGLTYSLCRQALTKHDNNIEHAEAWLKQLDPDQESIGDLDYGPKRRSITNPYETSVPKRMKVKDPAYPDFEKMECLKWTNWRMLRDIKRRHKNAEYWQLRANLKNIASCRGLPLVIRDAALEERNECPRDSSIVRQNNRCALTSRPRGIFHRYRLSRMVWRDLADHGLLSGTIRAKWG